MAHGLTLLAATSAALMLAAPTAHAVTGSPPVTQPDSVTVSAGGGTPVDLTGNDSDADGDQLEVCRLGDLPGALAASFLADGVLIVQPRRRARGSYTLTYYACDSSYLTPGTVTVTVKPPPPTFDIIPVDDAPPGRVRLVNQFKNQTFHCEWRPLDSDKIEGKATVRPRTTVVIEVHEAKLAIDCSSPRMSVGATFGAATAASRSGRYSAKASGGGQAQTRLRSP